MFAERYFRHARRRWHALAGAAGALLLMAQVPLIQVPARAANQVDLILVLALDVSGSVDEDEFDLQRQGLAEAFRHPLIADAIQRGKYRRIVVCAVQWAGYDKQHVSVPWSVIDGMAGAARFAQRLADMPRRYPDGPTHLSGAIRFATTLTQTAPFAATRRVVDISGDGQNNIGEPPAKARRIALDLGITINGLVVLNASEKLVDYYRTKIIGGPGSFVVEAADYEDYPRAILRKLLREIDVRLS